MQTVYNEDNINLNYLNNYVKYYIDNNILYLYNTLYNKQITLNGSNKELNDIISSLHHGVDYKELINYLKKINNNPEETYEYLLQNFIIE